jgi:hypothetical protein
VRPSVGSVNVHTATDADISASADMSAELLRRCFVSLANIHSVAKPKTFSVSAT